MNYFAQLRADIRRNSVSEITAIFSYAYLVLTKMNLLLIEGIYLISQL